MGLRRNFTCIGWFVCQGHFLSSGWTGDFLSPMIAQLLVYNSDISSTYPIPVQYNSCMNETVQQPYLSILKLHFV